MPNLSGFRRLRLLVLVVGVVGMLGVGSSAHAATFNVTKTADTNGTCADTDCSLREAIAAANTNGEADTVNVPAGTYTLELGEIDIDPDGKLTVVGANARSTVIDGNDNGRIFHIEEPEVDPANPQTVELRQLTLRDGKLNNNGGAIDIDDDSSAGDAVVRLDTVTLTSNEATDGSDGGAINNDGQLTIVNSTLSDNSASDEGGAIENDDFLAMTNVTLSGNRALGEDDGERASGAFSNDGDDLEGEEEGVVEALNVTIAGNSADVGGATTTEAGTVTRFKNSIVANNTARVGSNCAVDESFEPGGSFVSQGNNLESADTCSFNASGDQRNTDPRLGPLQDNGGQTDTRALETGSPAIDAGTNTGCPDRDQRGVSRPQGPACDIGAFEVEQAQQQTSPAQDNRAPRVAIAGIPSRCVRGSFRIRVRIREGNFRRAAVYLDGKRVKRSSRRRFTVRINARRLRSGRHRITVRAVDRAGNRTSRTRRFTRCPRPAVRPNFTG